MQGSEPPVARADMVASVLFEVAQELDDSVEGEIPEGKPGDPAPLVGRDEQEEEPDRVPVAAHRGRTEALRRDQVVDEERVQEGPERLSFAHRAASTHTCAAKASNRRLASSNNARLMVRYTAVEAGLTWPMKVES